MISPIGLVFAAIYGFLTAMFFVRERPDFVELVREVPTWFIVVLMALACAGFCYFS